MFTCEFTHKGVRRQMSTNAPDDRMARISFSQVKKRANAQFEIHDETIKQHATLADMEAEIARFRAAQGKSEKPDDAELRQNALDVLDVPPARGSNGDDDVWW